MDKKKLFKGSSKVLGLNGAAKLLGIAVKVVISRLLGPVGFGVYELVLAITRLGSKIPLIGLHQTVVYYIPRYITSDKKRIGNYVIRIGLFIVLILSTICGYIVWLFEDSFSALFLNDQPDSWAIYACALLIPLFCVKNFTAYCYRGMKRVTEEVLLNNIGYPLFLLVGIGSLIALGIQLDINLVLNVVIAAAVIPVLLSIIGLGRRLFVPINWGFEKKVAQKILFYSFPIWGNSMLTVGIAQIDRLFIGAFSTAKELGFYGAAYTLAFMIKFILGSFNPISQPMISEAYGKNDLDRIQEIYRTIVDWTGFAIIPILGAFLLFGESMLGLVFGEEFKAAYWILCILGFAESINALSGPAGNILLMTSRQKISLYSLLAGFVSGIILNVILIPKFGALGAAIGTGISIMIVNFIRVYQIKVQLTVSHQFNNIIKTLFIVLFVGGLIALFKFYTGYGFIAFLLYIILVGIGYWRILRVDRLINKML